MQLRIDWSDPISWLITLMLLIVLVGQLVLIIRNPLLATGRKWLRAGLNLLLWLVLAGYFLQPRWQIQRPSSHALLVGDDVPTAIARQVKDSLHIQASFTSRNLNESYDSVTLVGQRFPIETLTQLSNSAVRWVPYNQPDQLQAIRWKSIVRQGELQRVTGRIQSSKKQVVRLRFGNQTLDSLMLNEGDNTFMLQFPAFARGRSQNELVLTTVPGRSTTLDTIRFFTRPTEPLRVQFLLNSPDFESKTLADWLGKQGHIVEVVTMLSKNIRSNVSLNKAGKSVDKTTPNLIITEPADATNAAVRKAIEEGKSVLFINLTNPETDCRTINQALGSKWQVRKTSNEPLVPVGNGLNALPYRFTDNLNQFGIAGYPIAVQRTIQRGRGFARPGLAGRIHAGRIGVSLLSETFPLALSGDSVAYNRIWSAVLARLSPSDKSTIQVNAPTYKGLQQEVSANTPGRSLPFLTIGQDTVRLTQSPINERSATGLGLFGQAGWQLVQDSLAVYVRARNPADPIANRQIISRFVLAHARERSVGNQPAQTRTAKIPNWLWLGLFIACFTVLWMEPKVL